jgi:two-component system, chemotaxis family, chemotaxis protein CheY
MNNGVIAKDVIIADNDRIIRSILRSLLDTSGFNVLQAVDGLEAIDYAMRTLARLVILDYKMPRLDGLAACGQIRRLPGYAGVPIAILTAFNDEKARVAAQAAGATVFFAKPFTAIDLLYGVSLLLGSSPASAGMRSGPSEPPAFVWKRRGDPPPLYGEPAELSEGRRVLNICRL